jgi:hypothetical protein
VPARRIVRPTTDAVITAHSTFAEAVKARALVHSGDPVLAGSVASSGRRPIGTAGGWGLKSIDGGDVTLAEAVVLAHHGAVTARTSRQSGRREAVVL